MKAIISNYKKNYIHYTNVQGAKMEYVIYIIAGLGAGIGTGFAGLSAADMISPDRKSDG